MPPEWSNWSGSVACRPHAVETPKDAQALARSLERAAVERRDVRVVGSGHSFTPLAATDGVLFCLDHLRGIESHDPARRRAWVRAGTKLKDLGGPLRELSLAMENLGDVDVQSVGGALGTGTHGTGRRLPNLSARASALRLLLASGEVVECSDERDPDLWRAARVCFGSLGILLAARLELVPAYRLHERVWRGPLAGILEKLDSLILENRHFEFFYFPKHDFAEAKAINPTQVAEGEIEGRKGERIGWSTDILPSVREDRFFEMEYSVPAEHGAECVQRVVERVRSHHPDVAWPLEYRTVAPDDAFLSMAQGRATVTISVHQDGALPFREFFADIEPIFHDYAGRPHWGKVHTLGARELCAVYPAWESFSSVRQRVDPDGRFQNEHLRRLLGA
jgi:FAD/FMN-containing dehydrogenase